MFYINIAPVDDSLPLVTNLGMRVQEGIRKTITEFELKGIDQDTPEDQVMFTIFREPTHGTIDFTTDERRYAPTVTFTMADIYENRISYNHDGSNTLEDSFAFTVSDGTNPVFLTERNTELVMTSTPQEFDITVLPVDDGTPRIVTNFGLDYLEYVEDRVSVFLRPHRQLLPLRHRDTSVQDILHRWFCTKVWAKQNLLNFFTDFRIILRFRKA